MVCLATGKGIYVSMQLVSTIKIKKGKEIHRLREVST